MSMENKSQRLRWWQFGMRNILNGMLLVSAFFAGYTVAATSSREQPKEEPREAWQSQHSLNDWPLPPSPVVDPNS